MPRMPDPPHGLKDDMPIYLYIAGKYIQFTRNKCVHEASLSVTDTGPGLTPKELDMLFQRFSQVSRK